MGAPPLLLLALLPRDEPVTREGAQDEARRELSRGIYHRDDPSLLRQALDYVVERLQHAFDGLTHATPGGPLGLAVILLLLLVAGGLVRVRLGPLRVADLLRDRDRLAAGRTAADYRGDADALAGAGDFAEALRARTRALVRELETRGVLDPRPGRTAAAVAREAAAAVPEVGADVRVVTSLFDEVWYGGRTATAAMCGTARDAEARVAAARLRLRAVPA